MTKPRTKARPAVRGPGRRKDGSRNAHVLWLAVALALVTFAVFARTLGHPFANIDDQVYVVRNPHLQGGLAPPNLAWALTSIYAANWHPVTWWSLLLDAQLYGLRPAGYHLTNLLLHLAAAVVLLLALVRMTGAIWRSAFVAALFALHPQRVESVAWIAERKDVLSAFFWMLTLWAYARWAQKPARGRYVLVILVYLLGLMSKPMLVSLPFVLLLLDFWPLRRAGPAGNAGSFPARTLRVLVLEKTPLLLLAIASSALTFVAQRRGEAVASTAALSLGDRLANAVVAYARYLGKMLWPSDLAVLYPHPGSSLPLWQVLGAIGLLAGLTLLAWRGRRRGYLVTGWLWYLVTLVPVIGLVQVGSAAMADRYTYLTHLGLYLVVAWGVPDLAARSGSPAPPRRLLSAAAAAVLLALGVCTWMQAGVWKDNVTLWTHAINVTKHNYRAHANLAQVLRDQGRLPEAEAQYREAIRLKPDEPGFWVNLGLVLTERGNFEEAIACQTKALALDPQLPEAYDARGLALVRRQKLAEALVDFRRAAELQPEQPDHLYNYGLTLANLGRLDEAEAEFRRVLAAHPGHARSRDMLERLSRARASAGPAVRPEGAPPAPPGGGRP